MLELPQRKWNTGSLYAEFRAMRIKHPLHDAAVGTFEDLRLRKVYAPDEEQTTASMFAGSQSGKTTTVRWYIENQIVDECFRRGIFNEKDRDTPRHILAKVQTLALYVKLKSSTTMSKLVAAFLVALGDPYPMKGTIGERLLRVDKALRKKGYEIIFIDESQHIRINQSAGSISRQDDATDVQNTFKDILTSTWPIVFVGLPAAKKIVFEEQLDTRSENPIFFGPLSAGDDEHMETFQKFCGRLSMKLVQHGILPNRAEILVTGDVPLCLHVASAGRLGLVTVIVRKALEIAFKEKRDEIERKDLQEAVRLFSMRIKLCDYNPFIEGARELPVVQEKAA
ncbi:AAA family ATPase [Rhizobium leguminosarum]